MGRRLKKAETEQYENQLQKIIAIEIPQKDYEILKEEDKQEVKKKYEESKNDLSNLIDYFEDKGYSHATEYLKNYPGYNTFRGWILLPSHRRRY